MTRARGTWTGAGPRLTGMGVCGAAVLGLVLVPGSGRAQEAAAETAPEPPPSQGAVPAQASAGNRPWEVGVTPEIRARALERFGVANHHFAESEYPEAARAYREALEVWDHPRIHGNLATVLVFLDAPMEALAHLREALRYGASPFESHVYQQLLGHRRLLHQQLARVTVRCASSGARVRVDGESRFGCPSGGTELMTAGSHELVARRPGYLTFTRAFTAVGGEETLIEVELLPLADAARFERYWEEWIPWTIFGVGAGVGLLGALPLAAAIDTRDQFERELELSCPSGCPRDELPASLTSLADWTERWNTIAWTTFVAGGLATVTGAVLLVLNQERRIEVDESGQRVSARPLLGPDLAGVALWGSLP